MSEAMVNDIVIHYDRAGHGEPVVLLHGLGSSGEDWEHQLRALDGHQAIIPDLRGHGRSSKPPGPYTIPGFAADVTALMDQLEIGPATLVGISLGGMVGFQIVADRPDLVSHLVAVNALPAFETTRVSQRVQLALRKVITRRLTMDRIGAILSKRLFPDAGMEVERATMVERWSRNDKPPYEATFAAILAWEGVAAEMADTSVPITVISSDLDYIGPADKEPYVDAMPTAEMIVIADAHHGVPMEHPSRFNDLLIEAIG